MKKLVYAFLICCLLSSCTFLTKRTVGVMVSDHMLPNIDEGDWIQFDRSVRTFTYGDIVYVELKVDWQDELMRSVYRVVGLPGDSIAVDKDICIINGKKNRYTPVREVVMYEEGMEQYPNGVDVLIGNTSAVYSHKYGDMKTVYIPKDHYFVLGDYRGTSADSRHFGVVPKDKIVGKVIDIAKAEE